jgi:hypothetical protein
MSECAAGLLKRMLAGECEAVLAEFLQRAAERQLLTPPELLPGLFGLDKKDLRPLVQAVAGERGRWLAAQNPAWTDALVHPGEETWETGTTGQRLALLRRTRQATPDKARSWSKARGSKTRQKRGQLISALHAGLSMEMNPSSRPAWLMAGRKCGGSPLPADATAQVTVCSPRVSDWSRC